ncbi:hypothetical protein [Aeromicrobium sp.]|uniref:hypothetical protein n=1 Tax=Aeromicrobium sp. TaxID=1871063 RepID=UPI0019ABDCCD|nr:hypothetical protein [Aeromicrobium sp.]MBC7632542.1 hypothetical protein [Aeromicrobium sp.]
MKISMTRKSRFGVAAALLFLAVTASACGAGSISPPASKVPTDGSSPSAAATDKRVPIEKNPPGDIPDNLAFVAYTNKAGSYAFTHPEGWAQTGANANVQFTDKLNGVNVDSLSASQAPNVANAKSTDVPRLKKSVPAFELRKVSAVTLPGGTGVRIVFRRNSEPDAVTGKVYRDEVEEYSVFKSGRLVRMDLYGPVGADNVDAYRTMSQSLSIR